MGDRLTDRAGGRADGCQGSRAPWSCFVSWVVVGCIDWVSPFRVLMIWRACTHIGGVWEEGQMAVGVVRFHCIRNTCSAPEEKTSSDNSESNDRAPPGLWRRPEGAMDGTARFGMEQASKQQRPTSEPTNKDNSRAGSSSSSSSSRNQICIPRAGAAPFFILTHQSGRHEGVFKR